MPNLFITSVSEKGGKTMFCAGLGKSWLDSGKKVGYLKLIPSEKASQTAGADKDVFFMQKLLCLQDPLEIINPVIGAQVEMTGAIIKACAAVSQNKDIVVIEGPSLNLSVSFIEALNTPVLVLQDYSTQLSAVLPEYQKLGRRLIGVALNKVPRNKIGRIQEQMSAALAEAGITLLGVIPEDRILMTLSIQDLAELLQGKILNNAEKGDDLIENFMIGSSTFDRGAAYYNRKNNKAVILWGDRPGVRKAALSNLQLAALQTSTRCIVISASAAPIPAVAKKAEEVQIPLVSAPGTVPDLVTALENSVSKIKFNQEKKIPHLVQILGQSFKTDLLTQRLAFMQGA
jgi:uncharacterized protein